MIQENFVTPYCDDQPIMNDTDLQILIEDKWDKK